MDVTMNKLTMDFICNVISFVSEFKAPYQIL